MRCVVEDGSDAQAAVNLQWKTSPAVVKIEKPASGFIPIIPASPSHPSGSLSPSRLLPCRSLPMSRIASSTRHTSPAIPDYSLTVLTASPGHHRKCSTVWQSKPLPFRHHSPLK